MGIGMECREMTPGDLVVTRWGTRFMGRKFASVLGRGGITQHKREGDGATPAGVLRVVGMLYRPDRICQTTLPRWAETISPGDLWSDDPNDAAYNHHVRAPYGFSHERLRRADPLYDLILVTDWNYPFATPGKGSAIFLHRWRRPHYRTAGCVAFAPGDLAWIASRVALGARIIISG
jgi:L,D-peptidoglycan transpeptidase YkuD (ErfK/YbiS/YcfS/YnhG family)